MKQNVKLEGNVATIIYEFLDEEINILNNTKRVGYIEFRGERTEQEQLEEEICDKLMECGFLELDFDAWHKTYILTTLGKSLMSK